MMNNIYYSMVLHNLFKQKTFSTTISVFFLIISFLAPYCHSHDHASGHHFNGDEHYVDSEKYDMYDHEHSGIHLHIKKDFTRSSKTVTSHNKLKNTTAHLPAICCLTFEKEFHYITRYLPELNPESNINTVFSGVSPPAF